MYCVTPRESITSHKQRLFCPHVHENSSREIRGENIMTESMFPGIMDLREIPRQSEAFMLQSYLILWV
jgi:hypothetical protein